MIVHGCRGVVGSHAWMACLRDVMLTSAWWSLTVSGLITVLVEVLMFAVSATVYINDAPAVVIE